MFTLIETNEGKPLKLYVYNSDSDMTREITLTPNNGWGGEGSLGCGIGYGYLHRIPIRTTTTPPVTKANLPSNTTSINGNNTMDKMALLSAIPASNVNNTPNVNFSFQPPNMSPINVAAPNTFAPTSFDTVAPTNDTISTTNISGTRSTPVNDPSQFAKYTENNQVF